MWSIHLLSILHRKLIRVKCRNIFRLFCTLISKVKIIISKPLEGKMWKRGKKEKNCVKKRGKKASFLVIKSSPRLQLFCSLEEKYKTSKYIPLSHFDWNPNTDQAFGNLRVPGCIIVTNWIDFSTAPLNSSLQYNSFPFYRHHSSFYQPEQHDWIRTKRWKNFGLRYNLKILNSWKFELFMLSEQIWNKILISQFHWLVYWKKNS